MNVKKQAQYRKGFTLIEMIVSVSIFVTVMTVSAGGLLTIIDASRKAHALKSVMDNLNFALENISRNIRVGTSYACGTNINTSSPNCATGNTSFTYRTQNNVVTTYFFQNDAVGNGRIYITTPVGTQTLTSDEINITSMMFYVDGVNLGAQQPRLVIALKGTAGQGKYKSDFNIATAITKR